MHVSDRLCFFAELKRRHVLRAGVLYIGAIWALAQGISQLGPSFDSPNWFTRWFVIGSAIGFPFWLIFSWRGDVKTALAEAAAAAVPASIGLPTTTDAKALP